MHHITTMDLQLIGFVALVACMFSRLARQVTFSIILGGIAVGAPMIATGRIELPPLATLLPFALPF